MATKFCIFGQVPVQDMNCVVGDDFYAPLNLIDSVTGQPEYITLWTFFASIYDSYAAKANGDQPLIKSLMGTGFTIVDGPGGLLGWSIPEADTRSIVVANTTPYGMDVPQRSCVYDLIAIDENGLEKTYQRGTFTFQMRLTSTG